MDDIAGIPPALSTHQGVEVFSLDKYADSTKDRTHYLGPNAGGRVGLRDLLATYYRIDDIAGFFSRNLQFRKITLQFPDTLTMDSTFVCQLLQQRLEDDDSAHEESKVSKSCSNEVCCGLSDCKEKFHVKEQANRRRIWILADTAYSACCVDEVASEHIGGDIVVHFGDACLSAVQKLPVLYVFGQPYLDLDVVISKFQQTYPDKASKVCLMADASYSFHLTDLDQALQVNGYYNLFVAEVNSQSAGPSAHIIDFKVARASQPVLTLGNRVLYSDNESFRDIDEEQLQSEFSLFHLTMPDNPRLLYLTTKFNSISVFDDSTQTVSQGPFPSMMKRYKYMHVARTAGTIGLLVNTLSLKNTKQLITQLANLIRDSGKKYYMFVVGKPNVAKLANFEAIDVWCVLGCAQSGIIIDQHNEFYKPIVTPYELSLALSPELTWTGSWVVDFKDVMNELSEEDHEESVDQQEPDTNQNEVISDADAPEFDAVTGRYVSTSRPLRHIDRVEIDVPQGSIEDSSSDQLVQKFAGAVSIRNTVSTSASALHSRMWSGLGSDFQSEDYEEEGATLEEGTSGVARQYQFDQDNRRQS
ncbi:LAMI_0H02058g1_1 [Lachancea mirantina]|uniref:2-(3-amino-3-carboxypropyl)histidine synthase subunit 2 n=1 Tax=Lachancea mirantina TaxID=1230905 RepID=A0A1G4KE79_9SACH|nr:LAMI_0H02058g1_1 [Lachancea mirantina]